MKTYAIVENGKVVNLISASEEFFKGQNVSYIEASKKFAIGDRIINGRLVKKRKPVGGEVANPGWHNADYTTLKPLTDDEIEALLDEASK